MVPEGNSERYLPRRIVSLQPSITVTLRDLGELGRLAACTKYCVEVCPEAEGRKIVADSWTARTTEIVECKADLVMASVPYQLEAVAEILKAGIPFVGLAPHSLRDVYQDIAHIGRLVGKEPRALEIIGDMKSQLAALHSRVKGHSRPRVFCEEWGKPVIASQPWVEELVEAVGGSFVGEAGKTVTAEAVGSEDPEVLIAAWCGAGDRVPLEKIVQSRGWKNMRAVQSGRVFCIRDEFLNTPATTLLQGARAMAWAIHPELFPRPEGIRQIKNNVGEGPIAVSERVV
jgi:iron complex transport system substrate-binding protein